MSRRSLLTGGAALAVGLAVDNIGKFSPLAKWLDDKVVGQFDYDEAVKEAKGFLKERYGINLVMGNEKDQDEFRGDPVALERYRVTLRLIVQEMSKYPPEMIHKIAEGRGLEIRVVDNLFVKEGQQESRREFRAGGLAPFLEQGKVAQLILDAGYAEHHQRAMVHHELNHRASQKWENQTERNKKWVGFHSKVSARSPYRKKREGAKDYDTTPERFFVIEYAATHPQEDEAVCAEMMMNPLRHLEFLNLWRNEQDKNVKDVLAVKYVETKRNYLNWSGGKIDDAFWQAIIKRGEEELANRKKPQVSG